MTVSVLMTSSGLDSELESYSNLRVGRNRRCRQLAGTLTTSQGRFILEFESGLELARDLRLSRRARLSAE
ncbi:hypothetical protein [Mycobacterium sp. MFM001]|uniref:hypothetical protein n=1 Tax=Mycobacterium sp. MFM001 TaxID=2049453 RepID=UPI000E2FB6D0|nr:hypothetical protein [Mycobacterium sp. MFM001]